MSLALILMGVSGSGKTSIGKALSAELDWSFFEGDDFHSEGNVARMKNGFPLSDADRIPWLESLSDLISDQLHAGNNIILACSALKEEYRRQLREGHDGVVFVFLDGDFELIWNRMQTRDDHYMKPEMLKSQFDTLESPSDALKVNIDQKINNIVQEIVEFIGDEQ